MGTEIGLELADSLVFAITGKHLSDLQRVILQDVWRHQTYREIAQRLRYTEGHVKDTASQLWQTLSQALNERVTKNNSRAVLERYLHLGKRPLALASADLPSALSPIGFVGREGAIADLHQLVQQGQRVIVLQGEGGIGKTTLAQQYLEHQTFDVTLELLMAKATDNITPVEQVVEEWLRQDFQREPGQDFGVTLARLKRQLREQRVGILIDNLEPALNAQGRFWIDHARYGDLLRVLCDPKGRTVTLLTSRDRLCEPGITVAHYRLPGLSLDSWQHFFMERGVTIGETSLAAMHHAYGGNAKGMTILCGAIREDFDGDGDAYWQENADDPLIALDLKNLVTSQIKRLQTLDPSAYRLFCRLGAYRYQDVARIPTEGVLALMWDIDPASQRQVIASLRNRSLVESHRGRFWLHPMVQAEALGHLRKSPDYRSAHTQAMEFWAHSIEGITTITEALQALEGYHHALAISDYAAAADVLLSSRHNQWGQYLTLGSTLYRMGLLQPVLTAIPPLLPQVSEDQRASELRNILADVYWISGQIHAAIATQLQAHTIACRGLEAALNTAEDAHAVYYWRMLAVDALLSLGLYHLDLWELSKAAQFFQSVITTAQGTSHQSWADKASLCLALVISYGDQGQRIQLPHSLQPTIQTESSAQTVATQLAEQAYTNIVDVSRPDYTGRFAFFIQLLGQTYTNLSHSHRAQTLYERAIAFAEASHYVQVKARALLGLGQLARQQGNSLDAMQHITAALQLLEDLGAKSDLAEAYYQMGLTHQHQARPAAANRQFAKAIQHYSDIQAPCQVAKVQTAQQL